MYRSANTTRVQAKARLVSIDTTRIHCSDQISYDEILYSLSNSNISKCIKLRYDEKWVVQKLEIFGNTQGYFGHFDDIFYIHL